MCENIHILSLRLICTFSIPHQSVHRISWGCTVTVYSKFDKKFPIHKIFSSPWAVILSQGLQILLQIDFGWDTLYTILANTVAVIWSKIKKQN